MGGLALLWCASHLPPPTRRDQRLISLRAGIPSDLGPMSDAHGDGGSDFTAAAMKYFRRRLHSRNKPGTQQEGRTSTWDSTHSPGSPTTASTSQPTSVLNGAPDLPQPSQPSHLSEVPEATPSARQEPGCSKDHPPTQETSDVSAPLPVQASGDARTSPLTLVVEENAIPSPLTAVVKEETMTVRDASTFDLSKGATVADSPSLWDLAYDKLCENSRDQDSLALFEERMARHWAGTLGEETLGGLLSTSVRKGRATSSSLTGLKKRTGGDGCWSGGRRTMASRLATREAMPKLPSALRPPKGWQRS